VSKLPSLLPYGGVNPAGMRGGRLTWWCTRRYGGKGKLSREITARRGARQTVDLSSQVRQSARNRLAPFRATTAATLLNGTSPTEGCHDGLATHSKLANGRGLGTASTEK